jgi:hypothetical protein
MNYFVSKDELEEMRENMFNAVARALYELEQRVSLLVNVGLIKSDPAKVRKGVMKMSEIKELVEELKTLSEGNNDEGLRDIILRLEGALEKDAEKWKDFKLKLDDMVGRVNVLEDEKKEEKQD